MTSKKILEIACFNLESALIAQAAGADRIELCENYDVGGNSPSVKNITTARERITIPLHVIIRPRPEDFGDPFLLSPAMQIHWHGWNRVRRPYKRKGNRYYSLHPVD